MYKEAFAGFLVLLTLYFLYRCLWKRRRNTAALILFAILFLSCIANGIYNAIVMFPDFYMDTVNGPFRYGTFSGNLLAYSDEFMFQDTILFPILKGRQVSLDEEAGFYEKYVSLYAESYAPVRITEKGRSALRSHQEEFDFSHQFTCIGIMDYVTDEIPDELLPSFEEEIYPMLHIHTGSLAGQDHLVFVMEPDYSLYVMGRTYYQEITGE